MKLLIINGSPRTNGATGQILHYIGEKLCLLDSTIEMQFVELSKYDLKLCSGCLTCYKTGICHIQDDGIEELSHQIDQCDGVVFGSPTYASNVSAHFKVLIDRGHFIFEQLLRDKACFSVVTYENIGGGQAQKVIHNLIHYSGGSVSNKYKLKLNHNIKPLTAQVQKTLDKKCFQYLRMAKRKNSLSITERIMRYAIFRFGLYAHAKKNESRYKGIIARWEDKVIC